MQCSGALIARVPKGSSSALTREQKHTAVQHAYKSQYSIDNLELAEISPTWVSLVTIEPLCLEREIDRQMQNENPNRALVQPLLVDGVAEGAWSGNSDLAQALSQG